jgi:hypothetical protein
MATTRQRNPQGMDLKEGNDTSKARALIMRPVGEEGKDLASIELSCFADADLELARGSLGDSDVPIVFRKDNGVGSYKSETCQMSGMGELRSVPMSFKEKAKRRPSKTTEKPRKAISSS